MILKTKYNDECTILYIYIHMIIGGMLAIKSIPYNLRKIILLIILIYQFGQLLFNVRYFFYKNKLLKQNSIKHTLNKLLDHLLGYCIISLILNLNMD